MEQDNGRSPLRGSGCQPSASAADASSPSVSIPNAGMFGVLSGYGFEVVEITRVTEQCFWYTGHRYRGSREIRAYRDKLICWTAERAAAERASERLKSAEAESERRMREARVWFQNQQKKIAASAMSARSAETEGLSPRDASAAPEGGDAR